MKRVTPPRFSLSAFSKNESQYNPFRINTGDNWTACRSYSVVAHHEGLEPLTRVQIPVRAPNTSVFADSIPIRLRRNNLDIAILNGINPV